MPFTITSCYNMRIAASKRRRAIRHDHAETQRLPASAVYRLAKLPPRPCLLVRSYIHYVKVQPLPHFRAFISSNGHVHMTFIWHSLDGESTMYY
jgi:hypothetical protein